ncbi:MAG: dTDP-4-dehydrorhamnose reductase [Rhodanobacteraceae bacterium]
MRVLLLGANGQAGHELLRSLRALNPSPLGGEIALNPSPQRGEGSERAARAGEGEPGACEIFPATREGRLVDGGECERIDLSDLDGMRSALDRIAPDLIVNAAAYTAVDRAEDEPELALRINGEAVGVLGAWAAGRGARVLHYSTDYVFDGNATQPYRENDATNPLGAYGHSKLAGEKALRDSGARHLILRTAWVYAARGNNFLRTMLRLGIERDELRVVDDQVGAPTSARLIADASARVIARWCADDDTINVPGDGIYHLVASGQTSWCGFARAIFERAQNAGLRARAPRVVPIKTREYPTRAKRPAYSVLDTAKLRETFGVELPDWEMSLDTVIGKLAGTGV